MINDFFTEYTINRSLTFEKYFENMQKKQENPPVNAGDTESASNNSLRLNYARSARIMKTYQVNPELCKKMQEIREPQKWMIITEDWCGDSAQIVPFIYKISECSDKVELFIVLRDSNPEVMDRFLTNGTKSIPVLAIFNAKGGLLKRWGPRPQEAALLVKTLKEQEIPKEEFIEKLHLWYGRDKGKAIENEFTGLLNF
jgi:hypothetical protein